MKPKLYPCKECGKLVPIRSKGLCPACRQKQRLKNGEIKTVYYNIKPISEKRKKQKVEERGCLKPFFEMHISLLQKNPYSSFSGKRINEPNVSNIAHILPKRKNGGFHSIQCHFDNALYLTLQEHTTFDKLLDERNYEKLEQIFGKFWFDTVVPKIKKLLSIATEQNKMRLSLEEYLDNLQV